MDSELVYMEEAARRFGVSKEAMQMKVHRQEVAEDRKDQGIPRPIKVGGKWAWSRAVFDAHMDSLKGGKP